MRGFILFEGTYFRYKPIGMHWNDTFCRRIEKNGPTGCFIETNLNSTLIHQANHPENSCAG